MEPTTASTHERQQRFRDVYDAAYLDLLRFVRRRVHPSHAEDVVADVMLVAWRRLDDIPDSRSAARAWLFGVARKTLQNARRREDRHAAVACAWPSNGAIPPAPATTSNPLVRT